MFGVFIKLLKSILKLLDPSGVLVVMPMLLLVKFCGKHGDMLYITKLDELL